MTTVATTARSADRECNGSQWFALQVRPRFESLVTKHLSGRGFQNFLPTFEVHRTWSDRKKTFAAPLFPGYVFCKLDPRNRLPVLTTPGVQQIVGAGQTPIPLEEGEVKAVERIVETGFPRRPCSYLQTGDRVRIEKGPLIGLEGILLSERGQDRLILSVSLLQRSVALDIDRAWVSWAGSWQQGLSRFGNWAVA